MEKITPNTPDDCPFVPRKAEFFIAALLGIVACATNGLNVEGMTSFTYTTVGVIGIMELLRLAAYKTEAYLRDKKK